MKPSPLTKRTLQLACLAFALHSGQAHASAYGTLNNFDCVNPETEPCHGFEIELEDCHSTDISWTYNWNHYGVPTITEDDSVPEHVVCIVRWASAKNADGSWAAFTAVPTEPITPTNGHQFTNPNVNFGGEHFGVSYRGAPTSVRCHWLVDDGAGTLVKGTCVQISIPTFTYNAGQVVARVEPVEPPEVPVAEFGEATWVRSIKTTSHNNNRIKLRDLVSDDPEDEDDRNWKNGEPDEVEVEWQILQEEFAEDDGGGNGHLDGEPEDLNDDDEVITRRWEFYKYAGPYDVENHEALADKVAEDDLHGVGTTQAAGIEYDLDNTIVVGDFIGAQMSAFEIDGELSLIDHLQDCAVNVPVAERRVVLGGPAPFTATGTGALPDGMVFDELTGILSGTPTTSGEFTYTVEATDANTPPVSKNYTFRVAALGAALAPHSLVDTAVSSPGSGTATGDGAFDLGLQATVVATANPGYHFVHWTDDWNVVSTSSYYSFPVEFTRSLVAVFAPNGPPMTVSEMVGGSFDLAWPFDPPGWILQENPGLDPGSWLPSTLPVTDADGLHHVTITPLPAKSSFFRLALP